MKEVELILHRRFLGEKYTIGKFHDEHMKPMCDTMEDKTRDYNKDGDLLDAGETKIFGETAIPYGRYRVTIVDSPKFKRRVPLLHNVRHFTAIEIHSGTTERDSHGCILPGENKERGKVLRSRYWENKITQLIDRLINEGNTVFIKII
jgi:hypothetical protein